MIAAPAPITSEMGPQRLEAVIAALPWRERERLARRWFSPSALRAAKLAERDDLLLRMAIGLEGSAKAIAEAVHADLDRYVRQAWRFERRANAPVRARDALAHGVLTLTEGDVPSVRQLRRLFGAVAKKDPGNGHGNAR